MELDFPQLFVVLLISSWIVLCSSIPQIEQHPTSKSVIEGGLAILSCTVANLGNASVYWRYGDTYGVLSKNRDTESYAQVHHDLNHRLSIRGDTRHGEYNLLIRDVTLSDERPYVCSVVMPNGGAIYSAAAWITVQRPTTQSVPIPEHACTVLAINPPQIFNVGTMVRFICATPSGSAPQALAWTFFEDGNRTLLIDCPDSPCTLNRQLNISDVNRTFTCELLDRSFSPVGVECTFTPLRPQIDVVVDPPVYDHPPGHREGFMCFAVEYSPSSLIFEWYQDSQRIRNGTDQSFINLMINREDSGSRLFCVLSALDGSFRGIGHARIEPFDPSDVFPDVEGSSFPPPELETTRKAATEPSKGREETIINYTTTSPSNEGSILSLRPVAEISNIDTSSKHLSILVVVSAIAGALVTMLICAIGLVVMVFIRKRRKQFLVLEQNGSGHGADDCGQVEMRVVEGKEMVFCSNAETVENAMNAQRQSIGESDGEGTFDRYYATLERDAPETEEDTDIVKTTINGSPVAETPITVGPPCTPIEYARPQTRPLEISDQLHQGVFNDGLSKMHERTQSESSAGAYAVTDVVSHEGRFVFKAMSGRDEAHMGVCRLPSGERSATMSRALTRNQSAPPLPARTLPRTTSIPYDQSNDSLSQRRQSDSESLKDKSKLRPKSSFGHRWPWSIKNKKECSLESESKVQEVAPAECENRRLSVTSGESGDYAEIVSFDKDSESAPNKRHSVASERLVSIPERSSPANQYQDVEAYASSAALMENQPKFGKEATTSSGYDRLSRPNQIQARPLNRAGTMPIYAKVNKSKSLDHGGQRNSSKDAGQSNTHSDKTRDAKLLRSMSEGAAPSARRDKPRSVGGYDTVEISGTLDNILVQMRNGFPGETVDIPDGECKEPSPNKGGNFADIV